jgi:hypothetical protein
MSRNCYRSADGGPISVAHAALTGAQRLTKNRSIVLAANEYVEIDLSHETDEFLEIISHVDGSDGDSNILDVYESRGENDDLTDALTLTYTVGTQVVRGGTRLYHDTLTITETDEALEAVKSRDADNDIVKLWINTNGVSRLVFIATTLGSTDIKVEYAPLSRSSIPAVS